MNTSIKHVVIEDDCDCLDRNDPTPPCPERMIYIGELAQKSGFSSYKLRKWTKEDLIPVCRKPGERFMYREREALAAVRRIFDVYRTEGNPQGGNTPPPATPPPSSDTDGSQAA